MLFHEGITSPWHRPVILLGMVCNSSRLFSLWLWRRQNSKGLSATWNQGGNLYRRNKLPQKSLNIAWPQCLREACESSGCSWGTGGSHRLSWWCLQAQTWCHPQLSVSAQCLGSPATGLEPITSTDSCHLLLPNTTKKCTCKCKYQLQIILPVVILLQ